MLAVGHMLMGEEEQLPRAASGGASVSADAGGTGTFFLSASFKT
jgi:hypothetical protein